MFFINVFICYKLVVHVSIETIESWCSQNEFDFLQASFEADSFILDHVNNGGLAGQFYLYKRPIFLDVVGQIFNFVFTLLLYPSNLILEEEVFILELVFKLFVLLFKSGNFICVVLF